MSVEAAPKMRKVLRSRRSVGSALARLCLVGWAATLLSACAVSPYAPAPKLKSDGMLAAQITQARQALAASPAPRLLFAGIAMDDRSTAFRRDVALAEKFALAADPRAVRLELANPAWGQSADLPFATRENFQAVLQALDEMARPQDKVLLLLTSHGAPGRLSLHAGNQALGVVAAADLAQWTAPLRNRDLLVVVSACFSGSLIPSLSQDRHIVLTAAAKDRASFGCNSLSDNTYFIKELFGQPIAATTDLLSLMAGAVQGVDQRERDMRLAPPSLPQAFYGREAEAWAARPIVQWFSTP